MDNTNTNVDVMLFGLLYHYIVIIPQPEVMGWEKFCESKYRNTSVVAMLRM